SRGRIVSDESRGTYLGWGGCPVGAGSGMCPVGPGLAGGPPPALIAPGPPPGPPPPPSPGPRGARAGPCRLCRSATPARAWAGAGHGVGHAQGVQDGLLGTLDDGLVKRIERGVERHVDAGGHLLARTRQLVGRRERNEDLARPVRGIAAHAADA